MKNEFVSSPARPEIYDWISSDLIDSLAMVESGGKHLDADGNLTESPSGALGKYQWMPESAKDPGYGVEPFDITDEDAQRNATKQYLVGIQRKHPDWTPAQVLQAYNAGPGKMSRHMAGEKNLDGSSILKKETINYPGKVFAGMPAEEESGFPNYAPPMPPPVNQNEVPTYAKEEEEDPLADTQKKAQNLAVDQALDAIMGTSQAVGPMQRRGMMVPPRPESLGRTEKSRFDDTPDISGLITGTVPMSSISKQENSLITDGLIKYKDLPKEEMIKKIEEDYKNNFIGGARIGAARGLASVPPLQYFHRGTESVPDPYHMPISSEQRQAITGGDTHQKLQQAMLMGQPWTTVKQPEPTMDFNRMLYDSVEKHNDMNYAKPAVQKPEDYKDRFINASTLIRQNPNQGYRGGTDSVPMPGNLPKQYVEERFGGDIVPSMLTPGEAVIPVEAAQHPRFKPMINEMISYGRGVQDLNKGTSGVQYYESGTEGASNDGGGFFSNIWNSIKQDKWPWQKEEHEIIKASTPDSTNNDENSLENVELQGKRMVNTLAAPLHLGKNIINMAGDANEWLWDNTLGYGADILGGGANIAGGLGVPGADEAAKYLYDWADTSYVGDSWGRKEVREEREDLEESTNNPLEGSFTPGLTEGHRGDFTYTDDITGNKISVNEFGESVIEINPKTLHERGWIPSKEFLEEFKKPEENSFDVTESLDGFLEYFGWERKDAARLLLYYVGSRMTGASHGGSLAWAGQQALSDISGRKDRAATQASANSAALNAFQSDYNQDKELFTEEYRVKIQKAINEEDLNTARALVQEAYQLDDNKNYRGLHPLALQVNLGQREMFRNVQGGPVFNAFQSNDGKGYKFINSAGEIELITKDSKQYEMTNKEIASDNFMEEAASVWDGLTIAEKDTLSKYFTGTEGEGTRTMGRNSWQAQLGQFLIDNKMAQEKSASVMTNDLITLIKSGKLPKENKPTVRGLMEWMVVHGGMDASWVKALPVKASGNNMTAATIRNLQKDLSSEFVTVNEVIRDTDRQLTVSKKDGGYGLDLSDPKSLATIKQIVLNTLKSGDLGISSAEAEKIKGIADNTNPYIALLHISKINLEKEKRGK